MADDPTNPGDGPDEGDEPEPTPDPATGGGDSLGDAGRRAIEAERKARRDAEARLKARIKELEPLASKAKELEDSTKSEAQRLADERDAHRSRAERAEQDLLRLRVALRKGLTETQAKRLVGASEEDLEADADELLASFRPASGDEPPAVEKPAGRPKEKLRPGAVPDAESVELNPQKLADLVPRAGF